MALQTVQFKTSAAVAAESFRAVYVRTFYETDGETFATLDGTKNKVVYFTYKKFEVRFGVLSESQMDYLEELITFTAPQFIYNAGTYDVLVERVNARNRGGSIILTLTDPE